MSASGSWLRRVGLSVTSSSVDAMVKRFVLMSALVAMLFQQNVAHAQVTTVLKPVFNGVMNKAIGEGILANLERRALVTTADDVVFKETMTYVGKAVDAAVYMGPVVEVGAAVAGAPVWLTAAASVGAMAAVGAVAWGAYQLTQVGSGSSTQFQLKPNQSASPPNGASSPTGASSPPATGNMPGQEYAVEGSVYSSPGLAVTGYEALPATVPLFAAMLGGGPSRVAGCTSERDCVLISAIELSNQGCANNPTWANCVVVVPQGPDSYFTDAYGLRASNYSPVLWHIDTKDVPPPSSSSDAAVWVQPVYKNSVALTVYQNPDYVTAQNGYVGRVEVLPITSDMLALPLPPEISAKLAELLWEKASAMPGYDGYPYSVVDPVSSTDVATGTLPKWSDLVEGMPKAAGDLGVTVSPDFAATPGSGGTGSPTGASSAGTDCSQSGASSLAGCVPLGQAPGSDSLDGNSVSIPLNPWSIGPVSGTCPSPQTVSILGADYQFTFDPLCSVVQKLRPLMLALCALAAAFIVAMGVAL